MLRTKIERQIAFVPKFCLCFDRICLPLLRTVATSDSTIDPLHYAAMDRRSTFMNMLCCFAISVEFNNAMARHDLFIGIGNGNLHKLQSLHDMGVELFLVALVEGRGLRCELH